MIQRRVGTALLLGVLGIVIGLAIGLMEVASNPSPQIIETSGGGVTIHFEGDRTRFAFPGDCSTARWEVGGIQAVHFYGYPMVGMGEIPVCRGDAPYLQVSMRDQTSYVYRLKRDVLFLHPLVQVAALTALGMAGVGAYLLGAGGLLATRRGQYLAALALAVAWVVALDLYTNSAYVVIGPTFDAARTLEIARNGWLGNPDMLSPWAYRPVTPLFARAISDLLHVSLDTGFAVIAYTGGVAQLVLVFALARYFGASFRSALVAMAVVGLSFFNLRFLLYDIYRPDQLAFALIIAALLALLRRNWLLCLLIVCVGLLTREFLIFPAVLLALKLLIEGVRERSWRKLAWLVVVVITVGSVVALPRALIPVAGSAQRFDPLNRPDALQYELLQPWLNAPRNYEYLAVALSYLLPLLLLATPTRLHQAWTELASHRWLLAVYAVMALLLTMYGGGDVERFFPYIFVVPVILVAIWLRETSWFEIGLMLLVVAVTNRLFWMPDVDPNTVVHRIGSIVRWSVTMERFQEIAVYVTAAVGLRIFIAAIHKLIHQHRSKTFVVHCHH